MNKNSSLTIAIPAYNEIQSLPSLLSDIKNLSRQKNIRLKHLILVSDGSVDGTAEIIKNFTFPQTKITKIIDPKRKGKIYRLNQIFKLAKSKYLLILDADIKLGKSSINNLVQSAVKNKSLLTVSHQIPIEPTTFIGNIIYAGYSLWDDIRTSSPKYLDNVQNFYGAASLYDYDFYHYLTVPKQFHDERKYIYYSAKVHGKFVYEKSSIIYYHPVSTYQDFYIQGSRSAGIDEKIQQYFKQIILNTVSIPIVYKFKILLKHFFNNPFNIGLFLLLKYFVKITKISDPLLHKGMWTITSSTKIGFK
jgi:glycosyltransferase involved in cell wall biosynthesis